MLVFFFMFFSCIMYKNRGEKKKIDFSFNRLFNNFCFFLLVVMMLGISYLNGKIFFMYYYLIKDVS